MHEMLRRRAEALSRTNGDAGAVFLNHDVARYIGECGAQLDVFVKMVRLGWMPARTPVVTPQAGVANAPFLEL